MDGASTYYLTQGVLGVTVVVLGLVIAMLYKDNKRLEKEKIDQLELRRVDAIDTTKQVISVLHDSSQNIAILSEKIEISKQNARKR